MRLSSLIGAEVRDADGRSLGHIRELRAQDDGGTLRVTTVVLGRTGWRHRLTGRGGSDHEVAFADVVRRLG